MFYGMPIHIIRDVAITVRSFYKRLSDFIRYRQATKDMNTRYPDASADEIQREDVCIICREVMNATQRPYGATDSHSSKSHLEANNHDRNRQNNSDGAIRAGNERFRPKRLPCGHILHYTCLRSWLERQQNCPICRAPVIVSTPIASRSRSDNTIHDLRAQENQPPNNNQVRGGAAQPNITRNTFSLGPLRLSFGVGQNLNDTNATAPQIPARSSMELQQAGGSPNRLQRGSSVQEPVSTTISSTTISSSTIQSQLLQIEQQLSREIRALGAHATQLFLVRALEAELVRVRVEISQENLASMERVNLSQPFAMGFGQGSASPSEHQNIAASHGGSLDRLILPHGWNLVSLRGIKINGEIYNTISSLPALKSVISENSSIHAIVQSTFQPVMVKSQRIKQQVISPETGTDTEQSSSGLTISNTFAKISNIYSKNSDAQTHTVQLWNEKFCQ